MIYIKSAIMDYLNDENTWLKNKNKNKTKQNISFYITYNSTEVENEQNEQKHFRKSICNPWVMT